MKHCTRGLILILCSAAAGAGEIVFIDPSREQAKAQSPLPPPETRVEQRLEQTLDEARRWAGRGERGALFLEEKGQPPVAHEQAQEAQAYQRGERPSESGPIIILKQGPPPDTAAKARIEARSWVAPASSNQSRCKTENTVGSIEGRSGTSGSAVIQTTSGTVNVLCK